MDARTDAIVSNAVAVAVADAEELWKPEKFDGVYPTNGFGVMRLRPADLVLKTNQPGCRYSAMWTMSVATASAWETYITLTLSDSCYVVITGIFNYDATPDVEAIKFNADGVEYPLIQIDEMYGWDVAVAYFSHPIVIRPEKQLTIKAKARTAGFKNFGFIGYTVAKRSYLINET